MAKTTATVTVGADTSPFERKMRTLGRGLAGGVTTGVSRVGGMAMSGLGAGLGIGLGFLGLQSLPAIFDKLRAISPELNGALTKLKVTIQDALFPAAERLGKLLGDVLPSIETSLGTFGKALADAIEWWTEDALNPVVWKDIGNAIGESVVDAVNQAMTMFVGNQNGKQTFAQLVEQAAIEDDAPPWLARIYAANPIVQILSGNLFTSPFATREGPDSL